ncbi:hypothetical protein V1511DRAFT_520228 [Dipodascopsis uninucleata]
MAGASQKRRAQANVVALKNMHVASMVINGLYLLSYFVLHRPRSLKTYLIFSIPAWIIQYQLEKIGRPKYSTLNGALVTAGEDLNQPGLTEWLFDILYVTWGCDILGVIFGRGWVWFLYSLIPLYSFYKAYTSIIVPMMENRAAITALEKNQEPTESETKKSKNKKEKVKYMH